MINIIASDLFLLLLCYCFVRSQASKPWWNQTVQRPAGAGTMFVRTWTLEEEDW